VSLWYPGGWMGVDVRFILAEARCPASSMRRRICVGVGRRGRTPPASSPMSPLVHLVQGHACKGGIPLMGRGEGIIPICA
jgi:hypothetical protein